MIGKRFGRLVAIGVAKDRKSVFRCDCGTVKEIITRNVLKGLTNSCGCIQREVTAARSTKHGFAKRSSKEPIYRSWAALKDRCSNENTKSFKDYGGRGITVCERWKDFENFKNDMLPTWKRGLMIERVDNSKGYCPENCIWADRKTQNRNKRNARLITCNGETLNASEWAERIGGNMDIIYIRLKRGWTPERAVTTPVLWDRSKYQHHTP